MGLSEYDNIKTIEELAAKVDAEGGYCNRYIDVIRMREIFVNATEQERVAVAENENLSYAFYSIIFRVWNWKEGVKFYNKHSNPELAEKDKRIAELEAELTKMRELCDSTAELLLDEEKDKEIAELREKLHNAVETADRLDDELCKAREEITRLKAKIYDLEHPEE